MTWLLLITPLAGIAFLLIGLSISHRVRPLTYVGDTPNSVDYDRLVAVTANALAKGIVSSVRKATARASSPDDQDEFDAPIAVENRRRGQR